MSAPASFTLPWAVRLHRPGDYAAALKGRRIARGTWLALHVSASVSATVLAVRPGLPGARLGLIVAKRLAKRAVTRNAVKRVVREAFRLVRHELPPCDFVFRLVSPVAPCSLTVLKKRLRAEADTLLRQACTRCGGQSVAGCRAAGLQANHAGLPSGLSHADAPCSRPC